MACAKPPNPRSVTAPAKTAHPARATAADSMREIRELIRKTDPTKIFQKGFDRAEFLLERARNAGASPAELAKLEEQIRTLKGEGHRQMREQLIRHTPLFGREGPSTASKANVNMVIGALEKNGHWAEKEIRANLINMIERNGRIPDAYKPQLRHDVATVLRMCPHAGGLVRELTLRGQRGATGSSSKLGSQSNAGVGAAYEIMGAAALTKGSKPSNPGAPALFIQPGVDIVTFGDKSHMNQRSRDGVNWQSPTRTTIECDLRIAHPMGFEGYREIGIDFKHVSEGARHSSADLRNQVENVVEAIKEGQLHEYHFVTNREFGSGFKEVIAEANAELSRCGESLIGLHEYVTTLNTDPTG